MGIGETYSHLSTFSVVFDVDVFVLFTFALRVPFVAQATLLVYGTVRSPGFVVVGAYFPARFCFYGACGDADALGFALFVYLAHSTSAAVDFNARI